jgi:DNA-3-methyladenine glycosylase
VAAGAVARDLSTLLGGPSLTTRLDRGFFARDTQTVARELLGKLIVSRVCPGLPRVARIVEVEAYLGERDAASHARRGPTPRSAVMFGAPGHLYVYLIYGMHHCMNVVTEAEGVAGAVLLRAAAPVSGFEDPGSPAVTSGRGLAGPGRLCAALGITRAQNGLDLVSGPGADLLAIHAAPAAARPSPNEHAAGRRAPPARVRRSARIGVDYAGAWAARKLRFYLAGDPAVSVRPRD